MNDYISNMNPIRMDHSVYTPGQYETALHCNVVSHVHMHKMIREYVLVI